MDPISSIMTALVTGAAVALKPTADNLIKDAYASLKELIRQKYAHVDVPELEKNPASKNRQAVLQEDLEASDAKQDEELLRKVQALLDAISAHASNATQTVGLKLEDIKGASLTVERILAQGHNPTGVEVKSIDIQKDIKISDVTARSEEGASPKNR